MHAILMFGIRGSKYSYLWLSSDCANIDVDRLNAKEVLVAAAIEISDWFTADIVVGKKRVIVRT